MERYFDSELKELKEKILNMSAMVEEAMNNSLKAFMERKETIAQQVIDNDKVIDMLELEIDDLCIRILALYQPQAGDLRFIAATMKINNDLERMADIAVNISERALDLLKVPPVELHGDIYKMAKCTQKMLRDCIEALVTSDTELAQAVCRRDDEVDDYYAKLFKELLAVMHDDNTTIERSLDLIHVSKALERIADHATNICEDVIYMVEGKVIKHHKEE